MKYRMAEDIEWQEQLLTARLDHQGVVAGRVPRCGYGLNSRYHLILIAVESKLSIVVNQGSELIPGKFIERSCEFGDVFPMQILPLQLW